MRFTGVALACGLMVSGGGAFAQDTAADAPASFEQTLTRAESGDVAAQNALGQRYLSGDGVLQNFASAAQWLTKAAAQGDADAQNQLARLYFEGLGVSQDKSRAITLFEQAAVAGNPAHLTDLARVLETDPASISRAASLYADAAKAGDVEAMVSLGTLYQSGRGVAQNFDLARGLYEAAGVEGNGRAINNLGLMYVRGEGVEQDYETAAKLFETAAEAGVKQAFRNLGVLYENGFGVPMDEEIAKALYRQGGQGADAPAAPVARYVYDPRLAPINADALTSVQSAARVNDPVAQFQLGWLMLQSEAANLQTHRSAAQWFRRAAQAGYGPAMTNLGMMYFRGEGVLQDYVLGYMWMSLGTAAGVTLDPALSAEFAAVPTAEQINEAQLRVRDRLSNLQP